MRRLLLAIGLLALPIQAPAATLTLDVQPVRICTDDSCAPARFGRKYLGRIWDQAGIELNILRPYRTEVRPLSKGSSAALDARDTLYTFASRQRADGIRPNTAYLGFAEPLAGRTLGMAFVNSPGLDPWPYGIVEPQKNRRYGGAIAAHEIGHLLGLPHIEGETLMDPTFSPSEFENPAFLPPLSADIISAVRASSLLRPGATGVAGAETASIAAVPLPPAAALLAGGLVLLLRFRRR